VCESLIDALTLWCAGFRHVTAAYGTEGFTAEHLDTFARHQVRRVLIAFDRDDAGDKAAARVAGKPAGDGIVMHQNIGQPGDTSIFGWVVQNIGPGWLICDDGAGEVADFVHLAPDNTLTLVPVKAAHSESLHRQVSASAYEVVVGQATKNIGFLNGDELHARLSLAQTATRATWHDGVRQADRSGFLAALAAHPHSAAFGVKIVQPHLRKERYLQLKNPGDARD